MEALPWGWQATEARGSSPKDRLAPPGFPIIVKTNATSGPRARTQWPQELAQEAYGWVMAVYIACRLVYKRPRLGGDDEVLDSVQLEWLSHPLDPTRCRAHRQGSPGTELVRELDYVPEADDIDVQRLTQVDPDVVVALSKSGTCAVEQAGI